MTGKEHDDDIRVEAIAIPVDYDQLFVDRLEVLEQQLYEFRHARGLSEGSEDVGAFAQYVRDGATLFTVRSLHAGHLVIERHGSSVMIDFSNPEETLEITSGDHTSTIDADEAGLFVLGDVQSCLVKIDLDTPDQQQ